jgi:hypothetical protein
MRIKRYLLGFVLLTFMAAMSTPAYAGGCRCAMDAGKAEASAEKDVPPCHKKAAQEKAETTPGDKPCCDKGCNCDCAHMGGAVMLPAMHLSGATATTADYTLVEAILVPAPAIAPPVSPPKA